MKKYKRIKMLHAVETAGKEEGLIHRSTYLHHTLLRAFILFGIWACPRAQAAIWRLRAQAAATQRTGSGVPLLYPPPLIYKGMPPKEGGYTAAPPHALHSDAGAIHFLQHAIHHRIFDGIALVKRLYFFGA